MPIIGRNGEEMRKRSLAAYPDDCSFFDTPLTREQIIRVLLDEFTYWTASDELAAQGALGNVMAKIATGQEIENE